MFKPITLALEVAVAVLLWAEYFVMSIPADCKTSLTHLETVTLDTDFKGFT